MLRESDAFDSRYYYNYAGDESAIRLKYVFSLWYAELFQLNGTAEIKYDN